MSAREYDADRMSYLTSEEADAIVNRRPFENAMLTGYVTQGGTYMLATPSRWTDSGRPRDLIAILPADIGQGQVIRMYVAVNPELVEAVEELF